MKNSPKDSPIVASFSSRGLTEKEAEERIAKYGLNTLTDKRHFIILKQFISSFFSPLTLLLLAVSIISAFLGEIKDFFIIFGIVLFSGSITFYQHFKADHAAEKLKKKVLLTTLVIRDGMEKE